MGLHTRDSLPSQSRALVRAVGLALLAPPDRAASRAPGHGPDHPDPLGLEADRRGRSLEAGLGQRVGRVPVVARLRGPALEVNLHTNLGVALDREVGPQPSHVLAADLQGNLVLEVGL